jgi:hypothetical protein
MATASTVRLPPDLHAALTDYCRTYGASRNRVHALALRSWLGEGRAPAAPLERRYDKRGDGVHHVEDPHRP